MYTLEDYLFVRNTRYVIWGLVALVLALLIFHAGVAVGSRRDEGLRPSGPQGAFSGIWGMPLPHGYIAGGHGAVGEIESFTAPTLVIETRDDSTESVTVASTTTLNPEGSAATELVPGAHVIILGTPQNGILTATLIRILPQQ